MTGGPARRLPFRAACSTVAIAFAATPVAAAAATMPHYVVEPIRFEMQPEAKIGRRGRGVFCVPAGGIVWRDAVPDARRAGAIVAHVLKDAALDVYVPDEEWLDEHTPYAPARVFASVAEVGLNACTKQYGVWRIVDHRATLKGSGWMRVRWRVYDSATRARLFEAETCRRFEFDRDGLTLAEASDIGVATNAKAFAVLLNGGGAAASPAAPQADIGACPVMTASPPER